MCASRRHCLVVWVYTAQSCCGSHDESCLGVSLPCCTVIVSTFGVYMDGGGCQDGVCSFVLRVGFEVFGSEGGLSLSLGLGQTPRVRAAL
jgi:hypothetical protein